MKVVIVGTGYVGLPTGVGFAELGHDVVCVDKVEQKIIDLNNGIITLYEEGLEELFKKNLHSMKFTTDMKRSISGADVVILAVGTPPHPETMEADMRYIYAAVQELAVCLDKYTVVAVKSTVPVGTNDRIEQLIKEANPSAEYDVVSLPEFLREGFAVEDFFHPERVVVGLTNDKAKRIIDELYSVFSPQPPMLYVSRRSAETIKYASNSFLAMKIHFINEMANFCEKAGADIQEVAKGVGMDSRIGSRFLQTGPGYGGSCFPKDTNAMSRMAQKYGVEMHLINTTIEQNDQRKIDMAQKIADSVKGIPSPIIGVLGLTFKGGTDDVRDSPAVAIVAELVRRGFNVKAYDPQGMTNAKSILGDDLVYCDSAEEACNGADLCAVLTDWQEFKSLDFAKLQMKSKIVVDLRNMLDKKRLESLGYTVYRIGEQRQV